MPRLNLKSKRWLLVESRRNCCGCLWSCLLLLLLLWLCLLLQLLLWLLWLLGLVQSRLCRVVELFQRMCLDLVRVFTWT